MRTVLVTGCSSGIGHATATAFLERGWRVYATTREPASCRDLEADGATVVALDVGSADAVDRVVDRVLTETGRIDCLVNNAGYGQFGPLEDVSAAQLREQFEVNVFGPHRLARAVVPHMRERGTGTIVNVGSVDDRLPLAGIGAYNGSKFALAGMTAAFRQEVADHGVDVVLIEPGLVATGFYDRALAALPEATERSAAYEDVYRVLERIGFLRTAVPGVCEPDAVADVIVTAATADDPKPHYQAGPLGKPGVLAAELLPAALRDGIVRACISIGASEPVQRALRRLDDRTTARGRTTDERSSPSTDEPTSPSVSQNTD